MSSGELRHYVQINSPTNAVTSNGDYEAGKTWTLLANVWASVKYAKGSEDSGERDATMGQATIKIRHRTDITNKMQIVFGAVTFDIEDNFDPTGKSQYLIIPAKVSDGS